MLIPLIVMKLHLKLLELKTLFVVTMPECLSIRNIIYVKIIKYIYGVYHMVSKSECQSKVKETSPVKCYFSVKTVVITVKSNIITNYKIKHIMACSHFTL